ncbi:MAG: NAD-dependent epimerase/dehydratase family protein, partial [Elusimicrobiota bacterium]
MKVLVAGGLGFVGSNLSRCLVAAGARVTIVDNQLPSGGADPENLSGIASDVEVQLSDVCAPGVADRLVRDVRIVFHLAGASGHLRSMRYPAEDAHANADTTLALLEACRRRNPDARFVFTSSRQVYGRILHTPVDERHPVAPLDVNGIHKLMSEQYIQRYHRLYGLPVSILRLTNTYGPRQALKDHLGFMPCFLRRLREGQPIEIYGDGRQSRDLNHVDDVVAALLAAAISERAIGRTYNLGHTQSHSLRDIAGALIRAWGRGSFVLKPFPELSRAIEIGNYQGDSSRI